MTVSPRPTPNPNSLKFEVRGATLTDNARGLPYQSAREASGDALATALFGIRGVQSLLIAPDWVTVTKQVAADWDLLAAAVEEVLKEHVG